MKIIVFTPYYPPHVGGLETHAEEFNQHLSNDKKIEEITVVTFNIPDTIKDTKTISPKVTLIHLPAFEIIKNYPLPKFWTLKFWILYLRLFNKHHNLVISRTRFFSTSILAYIYSKIKKTYWIHIEHGSDFVQLSNNFKTIIAKLYDLTMGKLIFSSSDLNISISKAVQKFLKKFDRRFSPVIYRGINIQGINKIPPETKIKRKYRNKFIIAWAGRLYRWKGVEKSIKAVTNLPEKAKNKIVFLIIGNGEDFEKLKKIAPKPVYLLGQKTRIETIGILKVSDIYIHSSLPGGGLSTSLLEAMYCSCAVIASPHEGADEVIDNSTGILLKTPSSLEISEALQGLLMNPQEISILGRAARSSIAKKFNWKKTIHKYKKYIFNS